jgi:translation initiation factor 2-alpha kinase 4
LAAELTNAIVTDVAIDRVPSQLRANVLDILKQTKSTFSQKRAQMTKQGLPRNICDELELLSETEEDMDYLLNKVVKQSSTLAASLLPVFAEIRETIQYTGALGVTRPVVVHPLMLTEESHFKDGLFFEVVRRKKRTDVIASGGRCVCLHARHSPNTYLNSPIRYESLIASLAPPKQSGVASVCAVGVQIELDKITSALAAYQSTSVKTLIKEQRSFGFWSPRRCDVYIVSYQPGYLHDRLEVAAMLWQHGISADIMYESGLPDVEQESHLDTCIREGIL